MKGNRRAAKTILLENQMFFGVSRAAYRGVLRAYNRVHRLLDRKRSPYFDLYLYVDPQTIQLKTEIDSNKFRDIGKVQAGDWDLDVISFQEVYHYYGSLRSVLIHGGKWEDTELFHSGLERIGSGLTAWGCRNLPELRKRVDSIAQLFAAIRDHGYKFPATRKINGLSDEVSAHIGRSGELLFEDGGHRLTIAQLLNLKLIPVQVTLRHANWDAIRRRALPSAPNCRTGDFQRPTHPDIASVYKYLETMNHTPPPPN